MITLLALLALLNINAATVEQLDELPGVGPVLAQRIAEFREKRGGFQRVEKLLAIPGISERRWQILRGLVEVSETEETGETRDSGIEGQ